MQDPGDGPTHQANRASNPPADRHSGPAGRGTQKQGTYSMTTVYLLHYEQPIGNPAQTRGQAQHYTGSTDDLDRRLKEHKKGWSGAGIVRAFAAAHIPFVLARTWEDVPREFEHTLKHKRKNARRLCPICQAAKRSQHEAEQENI